MITLRKKIATINTEIELVTGTIIPDLRTEIGLLLEVLEGAEGEKEEAQVLGKLETLNDRMSGEHKTMVLLKQRRRKLVGYLTPRRKLRAPCGKC